MSCRGRHLGFDRTGNITFRSTKLTLGQNFEVFPLESIRDVEVQGSSRKEKGTGTQGSWRAGAIL